MVAKETTFTTIPLTEIKSKLFVYNWLLQKYVLEGNGLCAKSEASMEWRQEIPETTEKELYWTLTSSY